MYRSVQVITSRRLYLQSYPKATRGVSSLSLVTSFEQVNPLASGQACQMEIQRRLIWPPLQKYSTLTPLADSRTVEDPNPTRFLIIDTQLQSVVKSTCQLYPLGQK